MAKTNELSTTLRIFLKTYRWRTIDPVPLAELPKPLPECRVAFVSSAGFVVAGDPPFSDAVRGGDFSFRLIPAAADVQRLEEHHRSDSFSHAGIEADRNMGLPLDRLHELAAAGVIGEVAPRHISLMGSITAPGRLVKRTLPEIADIFVEDHVDVALMVPVWPVCMQTVGLAQQVVEQRGVATASITLLAEITKRIRPPRALSVPYPLGFPLGEANNATLQTAILTQLLALIERNDVPVLEDFSL